MPRSCQVTSAGPLMSGGRQNTSWPRHAAGSHSEDQAAGRDQSDTQVIGSALPARERGDQIASDWAAGSVAGNADSALRRS